MPTETLKAGRELDALIAEKVMGWALVSNQKANKAGWWGLAPGSSLMPLPYYSLSISDAWEVVEKLEEKGITMDMGQVWNGGEWMWAIQFQKIHLMTGQVDHYRQEYANTAPLAICLAALKVMDERESG